MRDWRGRAVLCASVLAALSVRAGDALVDPTAPPASIAHAVPAGEERRAAQPLLLQSVLVSATRRIAVIDGASVRVGDRVGGAVVTAIELTEVRLAGPTGEIRLPLHRTSTKERARSVEAPRR